MLDEVFLRTLQDTWEIIECAPLLLDWRDGLQQFAETKNTFASEVHHYAVGWYGLIPHFLNKNYG